MKKSVLYLLFNIAAIIGIAHAQSVPKIGYDTPVVFVAGKPISTLSPTNTGGKVYPANYGPSSLFANYTTPFSLAIDAADNIYTTNNTTGDISKYSPEGMLLFTINSGSSQASEVAIDAIGNIFVSQFTDNTVLKYDATGKLIATIHGFNDPYGIAFDSNNNAFVANYLDGKILKIAAGDTTATTYVTGLTTPYGMAIDAKNIIYVSEQSVGDIIKIAPGTLTKSIYSLGFNGPRHLSKDQFGNIYVADFGNNAVKRISAQGVATTISDNLSSPRQSAFDSSGNIFIADFGSNTLRRSTATSYAISDSLPAGLTFNNLNGQITGTPTSATAAKSYVITAYNTAGTATFPLVISISLPAKNVLNPPSVAASLPTSVSAGGATLNGFTNANDGNTIVTFFYSERPDLANTTEIIATSGGNVPNGTSNINALTILGLKPMTHYYYYLKATNDFGTALSDTITFSTLGIANSNDARLSELSTSAGSLNPQFSPQITSYQITLSDTTNSFKVNAIASNNKATVNVNGSKIIIGSLSTSIALVKGTNLLNIVVTAPDGITTQIYTLKIIRSTPPFDSPVKDDISTNPIAVTQPAIPIAPVDNDGKDSATQPDNPVAPAQPGNTTSQSGLEKNNEGDGDFKPLQPLPIQPDRNTDIDRMVIHQAVSPNGDGKNDYFQIEGLENYPDNKVTIINRNGVKVFEAKGYDNITKFFDGHSNISGSFQQQGTYYYQIEYAANRQTKRKIGYFILKY
ncbi:gliding motility-associated C-terminal domain-containing protein [Mucilaginibacter sp. UYCu711]|uniref:T9SS type B sorting domain-containing protein n=1 Tax=Mucilaginibacter sp. UYCu711 TaxID=3156339 RepID=UPI003D1E5762